MHIGSILFANNRCCNLVPAMNGIFLHTCNAPERIIDAVHRMDASISASSVNNAITSLSTQAMKDLRVKGQTMLVGYCLDNYDITFKHTTGTVNESLSNMVHLTSGLIVDLAHTSVKDLMHSSTLWQQSRFNDKRKKRPPPLSPQRLFSLHPETTTSTSLNYKEDFCRWRFAVDLCTHGPDYFSRFLDKIAPPVDIEKIPVTTTKSAPLKSMRYHNSTVDGNIQAIMDTMQQTGVWDCDKLMETTMLPGLEETVILFHGDLGTWERIENAQTRRALEETPRRRLQFVVFIPGLFHVKMACADAIWRIFLAKKQSHTDKTSMFSFIRLFYENLTTKITTNKAGFRILNDCIIRLGVSDRLECLRVFIQERFPNCHSLEDFAKKIPKLEDIEMLCSELARTFGSSAVTREDFRYKKASDRDFQYENTLTRIDHILLYEEFAYALRCGDVGRVETTLRRWIPIFKSTGKHKYATHLLRFMSDVHFSYPDDLKRAVRYNWLCNPTGTTMGFRGVDWLLERYNCSTKVTYGGSGSNYTVERVIKESTLIQLYGDCKKIIETQYELAPKTTRHAEKDLTDTYAAMSRLAQSTSLLQFTEGRATACQIPDYFSMGMKKYGDDWLKSRSEFDGLLTDDNFDEITEDDLGVEEENN